VLRPAVASPSVDLVIASSVGPPDRWPVSSRSGRAVPLRSCREWLLGHAGLGGYP